MPPPPVAGAAVGNGPAEGVRVTDGRAPALRVADGLTLGVLTVAVGLGKMLGDAEVATPGDNFGGAGGDPVQATADAEATRVAKPTAVSLALNPVPAVVVRIFMELLKPAADGGPFRARITTGIEGEPWLGLLAARVGGRQIPRQGRRR